MFLVLLSDNEHFADENMKGILCLLLMPWHVDPQSVFINIGSTTAVCSDPMGCELQCDGVSACAEGSFECVDTAICNVDCTGRLGCSGTSITVTANNTATSANILCHDNGVSLCDSLSVSLLSPAQPSNLSFTCAFTGNGVGCGDVVMDCNTMNGECLTDCDPVSDCQVEAHSLCLL